MHLPAMVYFRPGNFLWSVGQTCSRNHRIPSMFGIQFMAPRENREGNSYASEGGGSSLTGIPKGTGNTFTGSFGVREPEKKRASLSVMGTIPSNFRMTESS